ncbi:uncharacterized protein METZ01_LOCUS246825, partial [marine metagenome]
MDIPSSCNLDGTVKSELQFPDLIRHKQTLQVFLHDPSCHLPL